MKQFLKPFARVILLFVMLASCVTEMDINEISLEKEVNVNGICLSGEPVSATLLLTTPRIGELTCYGKDTIRYNELENAKVKLWVDGIETEQMTYLPADTTDEYNVDYTDSSEVVYLGYYKGQTICQPGKTYKIEVTHPNYETITCQTTIPNKISNVDIGEVNIQNISTNKSGWSNFKITFTDTPNEKNYYRTFITYTKGKIRSDSGADSINNEVLIRDSYYTNFTFEDPILFPENENANNLILGTADNKFNLFTDDFIDGQTHELDFTASKYYSSFDRELVAGEFFKITVTLQVINEDEYLYLKSLTQYRYFEDNYLAEPVQVYSNIENGVGIFSGAINYSRTFQFGDYPVDGIQYYYIKYGTIHY